MAGVGWTEHQRGELSPEVPSCVLRSAAQRMTVRKVPESGERATWKDVKEQSSHRVEKLRLQVSA